MNRIDRTFKELRREDKKALVTYITAGVPSLEYTMKLVRVLEESGADIIELGVPFSDPVADGPTIQRASEIALKNGTNLVQILRTVKSLRRDTEIPLVLMGYYNPFIAYGVKNVVTMMSECGVDGIIVPDLPPEEAKTLIQTTKEKDIHMIFLLAPTSNEKRIRMVARYTRGFIYYVSLTGVTGARRVLPEDIKENVKRIKLMTPLPVCVGFGISKPQHAKMLGEFADGIIVGSAIMKIILEEKSNKSALKKIGSFVSGLKKAM